MIEVFVEGLEFYAYHGVPAEERVLGHRYRLDLYMDVDSGAEEHDKISETVDYSQVSERVVASAQSAQAHTLERLSQILANQILDENPRVRHVRLELRKIAPPMPFIADAAGVVLEASR
jgi:7,8-dihydroneopterin aldolase/epimerase/oxygenase